MSLSGMSPREKTVVAILGIVILLALVGIGILAANLVSRSGEEGVAGESATAAAVEGEGQPAADVPEAAAGITPVATPILLEEPAVAADLPGGQVIVRQEGVGPLAPVVIADQALQPGRRYRIEIQAMDGSRVNIHGSWSQAAVGGGGSLSAPVIEFFEGQTPYRIDLNLPLATADRWSCSVSAALKDVTLASGSALAIEIQDVTGSQ
jgi:hypothetical protein